MGPSVAFSSVSELVVATTATGSSSYHESGSVYVAGRAADGTFSTSMISRDSRGRPRGGGSPRISRDGGSVVYSCDTRAIDEGDDLIVNTPCLWRAGSRTLASRSPGRDPTVADTGSVAFVAIGSEQAVVQSAAATTIVSTSQDGVKGNGPSVAAVVSPNGRFAAYESWASNIVASDRNGLADVFVRDLGTVSSRRASVTSAGSESSGSVPVRSHTFAKPGLAVDDRGSVAFVSQASDLVPDDRNGWVDVFVHVAPSDVELVGIEVNQAVQDLHNTVPLIRSRRTWARVHLETTRAGVYRRAEVVLEGRRDGAVLPGSPLGPVTVMAEPDTRRSRFDGSANFLLPHDWVSKPGPVELRAVPADGGTWNCREPRDADAGSGIAGDCRVRFRLTEGTDLHLRLVGLVWVDETGAAHAPAPRDFAAIEEDIEAQYPVRDVLASWSYAPFPARPGRPSLAETDANSFLTALRTREGCPPTHASLGGDYPPGSCWTVYYGLLKANANQYRGALLGSATRGSATASGLLVPDNPVSTRSTHAHEVGHALGMFHAVHSENGYTTSAWGTRQKVGWCGETAEAAVETAGDPRYEAPDYPHPIDVDTPDGRRRRPGLGPAARDPSRLIYGLDSRLAMLDPVRAVLSPARTFDLMSYCPGLDPAVGTFQWPSTFTYARLRGEIECRWPPSIPPASPCAAPKAGSLGAQSPGGVTSERRLLVRGLVHAPGNTGEFLPLLTADARGPDGEPGPYAVTMLDAAGAVLSSATIRPRPASAQAGSTDPATFLVSLPDDPDAHRVVLSRDGDELASVERSPSPPVVGFEDDGVRLAGDAVALAWTSSDPDGDELTYGLDYAADDGASWQALAVDLLAPTLVLPSSLLRSGAAARFRVTASDGFRSTSAESPALTVPRRAPVATISAPPDGSLVGAGGLVMLGHGYDADDGALPGDELEWSSDRAGPLGRGSFISLDSSRLDAGLHTITLTATDSDGMSTSATRSVRVTSDDVPPTIRLAASSPANERGWHSSSVEVAATAADDGEGVAALRIRVDGREAIDADGASASVRLSSDGVHQVTAWAVDRAGNAGGPATITIAVDTVPPDAEVLQPEGPLVVGRTTEVSLGASDSPAGGSGVHRVCVLVSTPGHPESCMPAAQQGGAWRVRADLPTGVYDFTAVATDRAGNEGRSVVRRVVVVAPP